MSDEASYRRKAESMLNQAAKATNMLERGRLIDEAMHWHMLALEAAERSRSPFLRTDEDDLGWAQAGRA